MTILLIAIGIAAGAGAGVVATRRYWPRVEVVERVIQVPVEVEAPARTDVPLPASAKRFRVLFATDSGSAARKLYESVTPRGDAVIEFWDGDQQRGDKPPLPMKDL